MGFAKKLLLTTLVTGAAAAVGAATTDPDTRWYRRQDLPSWQPPEELFPVAWTGLYALIATSSAATLNTLDERDAHGEAEAEAERRSFRRALGVNLVLNAAWPALFWKVQKNEVSAVGAVALAVSSADLMRRAWKVRRGAGVGLLPYAAWTTFAAVLNSDIARRNS
ncbi:tryptophan-rich sensory protein [Arcanobacterium wilhelmae]|uniref:Tryptophan-rich sensory protein n=1 Tax=Arcanobacterium wilhelmae TaxID=1803177 RepID=A0ABT9NBD2_9ACTO|nr:TspO/MBR family protein [Arcanobacterium wilhelmae]MDP9801013.1 tryptophan-rich sensory protein [Arcanobacterium wilhelmae]